MSPFKGAINVFRREKAIPTVTFWTTETCRKVTVKFTAIFWDVVDGLGTSDPRFLNLRLLLPRFDYAQCGSFFVS